MLLHMRTTLQIQDQLLIRAKKIAAETHRTLTSFVEDALRIALEEKPQGKALKPFKVVTFKGSGLRPGLDLDDTATLLDHLDDEEYASYRHKRSHKRS